MLVETASLTGAIIFVVGCVTAMAWGPTQSGFSQDLAKWMAAIPGGSVGFLAISIVARVRLIDAAASGLERIPVARLGVAGGDTSSFILKALAPTSLEWIGRPAQGIAMCRAHSEMPWLNGMKIMLKGGQMGGADLFELLITGTKA